MKSTGTFKPVMAIFLLLILLVQAGCSPARETAGVLLERELQETIRGAGIQYHKVLAFVPAPAGQKDLALIFYQLPGGLGASLAAKTTSGWELLGSGTASPGSGPESGMSWTCSNLGKGERSFPVFYGAIAEPKITGVRLELVNGESVGADVVESATSELKVWFVPPDIQTIPGKTAKVLKPSAVAVVGFSKSGEVLYTSDRDTFTPEHQARLSSIWMVDENTGWAMDGRRLLRTSDGGRNWADVTPPGVAKDARGLELEFLDASTAWLAVSSDSQPQLRVFRTTDGGRNWSGTAVEKKSGGNLYGAYVDFIDAKYGLLMIEPEHGMSSRPGELYQTDDGGANWSLVSLSGGRDGEGRLPFSGPVGFRDASTGWLPGRLGAAFIPDHPLYVTRDNGRSWQPQNLPLPPGCEGGGWLDIVSPPVFFNNKDREGHTSGSGLSTRVDAVEVSPVADGFLHAMFVPRTPDETMYATVVYITRDGGNSWQCAMPLKPPGEVDFVDADNGWVWVTRYSNPGTADPVKGTLYRTTDGGGSWVTIDPDRILESFLQQGYSVRKLDFVNKTTGWALLEAPQILLSAPGHPNRAATTLLQTTDGGRTWSPVMPLPG